METGRIFDNGVWRLKQNNRHQMEIFWPGGLKRHGDGWKLSVRIRFVHAQVWRLLAKTQEWEHDAWGVTISAAHLGYAVGCFASWCVKHSEALGARYSAEERAGYHSVWRCAGYLMGIPETILLTDESHARRIFRIGSMCEPPPTPEAIVMTNSLINSAPLVAGIEDTQAHEKLVKRVIYAISLGPHRKRPGRPVELFREKTILRAVLVPAGSATSRAESVVAEGRLQEFFGRFWRRRTTTTRAFRIGCPTTCTRNGPASCK